jgi:hypothetical protein
LLENSLSKEDLALPKQSGIESGLAQELQEIFTSLERCIELRSSYMNISKQVTGKQAQKTHTSQTGREKEMGYKRLYQSLFLERASLSLC